MLNNIVVHDLGDVSNVLFSMSNLPRDLILKSSCATLAGILEAFFVSSVYATSLYV